MDGVNAFMTLEGISRTLSAGFYLPQFHAAEGCADGVAGGGRGGEFGELLCELLCRRLRELRASRRRCCA